MSTDRSTGAGFCAVGFLARRPMVWHEHLAFRCSLSPDIYRIALY